MTIRDRIRELRRVPAGSLQPHPRNWRLHPPAQQQALRGVLEEIGYADALLVRELPGGVLQLLDGHLRAELSAQTLVPVLVVDLDDAEALKLLATLDPLAAMAETDRQAIQSLVEEVETDSEALAALLQSLVADDPLPEAGPDPTPPDVPIPESYQVVVHCDDEDQQRDVYERMKAEGFKCRVLCL